MEERLNIYNELPSFTQDYIKSIKSLNGLTELDTQLGVNFITLFDHKNLGLATEIIDLTNIESYALPIIVYNGKKWRNTFPNMLKILIQRIKYNSLEIIESTCHKYTYNYIDVVEIYNSIIYNTLVLYLKNGQQKLATIIILLVRTLFIIISEFNVNISTPEICKNNYLDQIESSIKNNVNIYRNKIHPSDWYWCMYSIIFESNKINEINLPINIWDIIIGLLTQPFLGKDCYTIDNLEEKLLMIILFQAIKNIDHLSINHINLNRCTNISSLIQSIHQNVGIQFEEYLICNGFVIEVFRSIFLNSNIMKLYYNENICHKLIIKQLSQIRYIYTNLRGIITLSIAISPESYLSEKNIAEMIIQNLFTNFNVRNDNLSDDKYLNILIQKNINLNKKLYKNIYKLCQHPIPFDVFMPPKVPHIHYSHNRNKFIIKLLPYIIEGNKLDLVKEMIECSINTRLMGEKKLMRLIYRFAPYRSQIREYYGDRVPKMNMNQYYIYPKWLKYLINKQFKNIIQHPNNKINLIPYIPTYDSLNIITQFHKHLSTQYNSINNTCLLCLNTYNYLKSFSHDIQKYGHQACETCFHKFNKCPFCMT